MKRIVLSLAFLVALAASPPALASKTPLRLPNVVRVGPVVVGSSTESAITVKNRSTEPLTLVSFEAFGTNGNFMLDLNDGCALTTVLTPRTSCTFGVVTSPFQKGPIRGEFCVTGIGTTLSDRECGRIVGRGKQPRA